MKKLKIFKAIIATMLLLMQFIIPSSVKAASIGESKSLERGTKGYYCVQKWDGSKWIYLTYNQTFYKDTDGQKYIAYCLSPGLPGVGYVSGEKESYSVKINKILDDDRIWRVLKNGYPNKSIGELGVETADDAYFATMQAINCILRGYSLDKTKTLYSAGKFAINGENLQDIQRRGNKTLVAMYNLVDIGLNGKETRQQFLNISVKADNAEPVREADGKYSLQYSVSSLAEISEYSIQKVEGMPSGCYTADTKGNKKTTFKGGEHFKIMIPQGSISKDVKGKVYVEAKQKNYKVYYGVSSVEGCQDYALCNNAYSEVYANADIYFQTNKSRLTISKVDASTGAPLKGVKFQIKNTSGDISVYTTNDQGKIIIANLRPGEMLIREIQTIGKYRIKTTEQKVQIGYNEIKEIKITNELQRGNIKIIKVDKDNENIKLKNVRFQLKDENGNIVKDGKTDEKGELTFQNLVVGKYKLIEVSTNKNYRLLDDEITVVVNDNKTVELKLQNELQKGNLKIVKVDKENKKIKLAGVEFNIIDSAGKIVRSGSTDKNGELFFKDLVAGKYQVQELKTGEKYRLCKDKVTVEIVDTKTSEVTVENELQKGNIKIIKVDRDNNEIKLKGVKFQVKDSENNVVKEGTTNEQGELTFENLAPGKYKIVETETCNNYQLSKEEIVVEVVDAKEIEVEVRNTKIVPEVEVKHPEKLPKTGTTNTALVAVTPVAISILGIAIYKLVLLIYEKHKKN